MVHREQRSSVWLTPALAAGASVCRTRRTNGTDRDNRCKVEECSDGKEENDNPYRAIFRTALVRSVALNMARMSAATSIPMDCLWANTPLHFVANGTGIFIRSHLFHYVLIDDP